MTGNPQALEKIETIGHVLRWVTPIILGLGLFILNGVARDQDDFKVQMDQDRKELRKTMTVFGESLVSTRERLIAIETRENNMARIETHLTQRIETHADRLKNIANRVRLLENKNADID